MVIRRYKTRDRSTMTNHAGSKVGLQGNNNKKTSPGLVAPKTVQKTGPDQTFTH